MRSADLDELSRQITAGSVRALARGLTMIEAASERTEILLERICSEAGRAHVVGITGAPGTGKSTLVRALVRAARARTLTVGVLAVDPSSPYTGGSILGDRIRMNDLATDPGVFIRSMATRGALGGLSAAAGDAIDLMSAAGRDLIFVETVGVGQDEVEIMQLAHTTVVVNVPGLGDEIQALKAGIMEIADIHVVNKADRQGFNRTLAEIKTAMAMSQHTAGGWNPPVLACVATREEGAAALLDEIARHLGHLRSSGELSDRELRMARARVLKIAGQITARLFETPLEQLGEDAGGDIALVARRELSPYASARLLLARAAAAERISADA